MKLLKFIAAILLAVIFSYITRHYLSTINMSVVGEFTPIPHFIADETLSYKLSMIPIFIVYLIIFLYLANYKFFGFAISLFGVFLAVRKYKEVAESYLPVDMAFVKALLEMAKMLGMVMIIAILVQWVVDGGLAAVRLVNGNRK